MRTLPEIPRADTLDPDLSAPSEGDSSFSDYLQIRDYTRILFRRRWIIVGCIAAGLVTALVINWLATPIFEAQATLQIDTDPNVLGVDRPLLPLDQRDWMREFLPTQLGILQSRDLARAAHDELESSARARGAVGELRVPTVGEIVGGRSVNLVKDTRLVNVSFRSTDPENAARVASALARAYVAKNLEFKSKSNADASEWLAKQVEEQRKLVREGEAALQQYRQEHGASSLFAGKLGVEQQNIVVQKQAELQSAVTKARTETAGKEAAYRQLLAVQANREPLDSVPAIASNTYIQTLKSELTALQRQMVQTAKELGERHPELIKLQEAVRNAERKLQTETATMAAAIRHDFEAAQSTERSLSSALERQKLEVQALNGKTVEYTAIEHEATSNREGLDKLLQRSREATLARQLQTNGVRIVDSAQVPDEPIFPRKMRTVMFGIVGSGAFALAIVFVLQLFNTRVMSPDDVKRHLRIRVMGVTPDVIPPNGHASPLLGSGAPVQFAELFQGLRTNLVSAPELVGHTVLVTSAEPGEGKTVSAANLAVSLAGLKQRVLLIDADLRKPRLHEMFGESLTPGLAELLKGNSTPRDFRKTKVSGLWLMPAGSASHNAANLLGSEHFGKLIDFLQRHFDWIVLDSPPVLAVTDPCLVARVSSGVLLVVDCRRTSREVASAAVERLHGVGATIVGAVLNRVVLDSRDTSYLPYYHRDYKTYYPDAEDSFLPPEVMASTLQNAGRST